MNKKLGIMVANALEDMSDEAIGQSPSIPHAVIAHEGEISIQNEVQLDAIITAFRETTENNLAAGPPKMRTPKHAIDATLQDRTS